MTWVTAFRDLKAREPAVNRHDAEYYMRHGGWLLGQRDIRLVAFVEPALLPRVAELRRGGDPALAHTRLVPWPADEQEEQGVRAVEAATKRLGQPARYSADKDTPRFVWLTHQKLRLCERVAQANPFAS